MDELIMANPELKAFVESINAIKEIDDNLLTDEMVNTVSNTISSAFSKESMGQAVGQILQNFESQGQTRAQAVEGLIAVKDLINTIVYGENVVSGNKKIILDMTVAKLYEIFDEAIARYHAYAIELPMTVDVLSGAKVPTFAHDTDAAADLYAMTDQVIPAHSYGNKIGTGVKIQLPEGWLAMILPRSSMGTKTPLRLSNSVGLIDSGYRGELGILYDNTSDEEYKIAAGDRIAQLLVMPSYRFKANVVDTLEDSDRGETGFGDSGK